MTVFTMTSYAGRHAHLYDTIYAGKDYDAEAAFIHDLLGRFAAAPVRNILELACGTGSHAIRLARLGYQVTATDNSPDMLEVARSKLGGSGAQVKFQLCDMQKLDASLRGFDAAVCLFDSIGYVRTNEAIAAVLDSLHAALHPGAVLVLEFWHAAAMIAGFEPLRVRRFSLPQGELLRITETSLEPEHQLARVQYDLLELRTDGRYERIREAQYNRYFQIQEMRLFLERAGFAPLAWYPGFTQHGALDEQAWHIVAAARRLP